MKLTRTRQCCGRIASAVIFSSLIEAHVFCMQNCAAPGTSANAPYALPILSFPFLQSEGESHLSSHACMYTHIAQHSKPRKSSASLHLSTRYEVISSGGGSDSQADFSSAARSLHRNQHQHSHYRQRRHGVIPSGFKRRRLSSASPSPSISVHKARRRRSGTSSSSSTCSSRTGAVNTSPDTTEAADSKKVTAATTRVFTQHFSILCVLFSIFSVGIFSLTDVCKYINASSTGLTEPETTTVG
ncbi:hypothetical protein TSMEX_002756 [Taenia solium]|eukprot:TsM_000486600 transcript=TsM_000486600 gene=TsM_000486600